MKNTGLVAILLIVIAIAGGWIIFNYANNSGATLPTQTNQPEPTPTTTQQSNTIVDVAVNSGNFNTLVKALQKAGLVDTLLGEGPFTVFAPTDEAFNKIPPETLNAVLADKEQLTKILTYHVIPGKVLAADVIKLQSAKTVQGQEVEIKVNDDQVMVNNANVIQTDIQANNGVIHVIDNVLMPE